VVGGGQTGPHSFHIWQVPLEEGEMLFYESAKCLHGRPRPFRGQWCPTRVENPSAYPSLSEQLAQGGRLR